MNKSINPDNIGHPVAIPRFALVGEHPYRRNVGVVASWTTGRTYAVKFGSASAKRIGMVLGRKVRMRVARNESINDMLNMAAGMPAAEVARRSAARSM